MCWNDGNYIISCLQSRRTIHASMMDHFLRTRFIFGLPKGEVDVHDIPKSAVTKWGKKRPYEYEDLTPQYALGQVGWNQHIVILAM